MHYIIDGYNYLFRSWRAEEGLKEQRQLFLSDLNSKVKILDLHATIVFDAQYASTEFSKSYFDSLEIIFTAQRETADEWILKELKKIENPQEYSVITSDRGLATQLKRLYVNTQSSESFIEELNRRYKNKIKRQEFPKETRKEKEAKIIEKLKAKYNEKPKEDKVEKVIFNVTSSQSFNYYLEIFEKRFQIEIQKNNSKPPKDQNIRD